MRFFSLFAFLALFVACLDFSPMTGAKSPPSSSSSSASGSTSLDPTAPECPEPALPCATGKECSFDSKRECMVCRCAPPLGQTPAVGGVPPL